MSRKSLISRIRSHIVPEHLPDEYFTLTPMDLKAAQATLSARTQTLINAPLQLRAMREAELKAKRNRWPEVLLIPLCIRVISQQILFRQLFVSDSQIRPNLKKYFLPPIKYDLSMPLYGNAFEKI